MKYLRLLAVLLLMMPSIGVASRGTFSLPVLPAPELYGNLLMRGESRRDDVAPVSFSHWLHRQYFTCSVCHEEIGFELQLNGTGVTEADNQAGRFCGACHDGTTAFPVSDKANCSKCHSGDRGTGADRFVRFSREYFPATRFGNRVDWVLALREGLIAPAASLKVAQKTVPFDKTLILEAEWNFVPPAIFPHASHLQWMQCSLCHPEPFMIKKKTTEHFRMQEILEGNFCGACHLNVAFPMDDCERCHPGME